MSELRVEEFYNFMQERERIRQAKQAGIPHPWTKDPILGEWKFTNVKREHDKTSVKLREDFYAPYKDAPRDEILFNCGVARYFGTWEFAVAVGWTRNCDLDEDPVGTFAYIRAMARTRLERGDRVFTGAYVITNNGLTGAKQDVVCGVFLEGLRRTRTQIVEAAFKTNSNGLWKPLVQHLGMVPGFGGSSFMAKETVLDLAYTNFWPLGHPVDNNEWTPVGPGSMRGAARVANRQPGSKMSGESTLKVCKELFEARHKYWPMGYPELELTDIQFQLCEFDKYERVKGGEGTPRSRYKHA
jgi:hypothetical protein